MGKYVLTIGKDYVSQWNIKDAIRELIQNKIDQEITDPTNIGSISIKNGKLFISNKTSELTKSSLVLGCSSKQNDDETIGKFGEGYKLALLVLIRNGINVVIHNYHTKENWIPTIEYVKEYDSELLVINTDRYWFTSPPNNNLTFVISGVENAQEILDEIILNEEAYKHYETDYGNILADGEKGNIYVNGLFVTNVEDLEYSYTIKPQYLNIGRDRNLVDEWDIKYLLASMWKQAPHDMTMEVIRAGAKDVEFVKYKSNDMDKVADELVVDLGNAIPVTNQYEVEQAQRMYGPKVKTKIVTESIKSLVEHKIPKPQVVVVKSNKELLETYYNKHKKKFSREMMKDWTKMQNLLLKEY